MRIVLAVAILTFGLLLGWIQTKALFAESALEKSREQAERNPASVTALNAATLAVEIAPWRPELRAELSWRLQATGRPKEARRQFALALSAAPADAYLWAEYAQLLARQGKFGREMEQVTQRSNHLGPTSGTIQQSHAETGLYYWSRGSSALQQEWLGSMKFMLRNDRDLFLQKVRGAGRAALFCLGPGAHLPLAGWCASIGPAT